MKNLKRLGATLALTFLLGMTALAGETNAPPCPPPEPGETNAPPCTGGQMAGDSSGSVSTPLTSDTSYLVAEAAINLFESLLPLY